VVLFVGAARPRLARASAADQANFGLRDTGAHTGWRVVESLVKHRVRRTRLSPRLLNGGVIRLSVQAWPAPFHLARPSVIFHERSTPLARNDFSTSRRYFYRHGDSAEPHSKARFARYEGARGPAGRMAQFAEPARQSGPTAGSQVATNPTTAPRYPDPTSSLAFGRGLISDLERFERSGYGSGEENAPRLGVCYAGCPVARPRSSVPPGENAELGQPRCIFRLNHK
jgi:hypothetical protein